MHMCSTTGSWSPVQTLRDDVAQPPIVLHLLIGQGWALTWHAGPIGFLDEHRARIQDQREVGRLTPVLLLVAMLDWHLDTFFAAAEELEREVDDLDDAALRGDEKNLLERLVAMRRRDLSCPPPAECPSRTCTPRYGATRISMPDVEPRETPRRSAPSPTASNA